MPQQRKTILVAEDNPALAAVVRFHLEQTGFRVKVARTGKEAWNLLLAEAFDIVVTDQQMPGMTGIEVCQAMRNHDRLADVPVIMLTAKGLELECGQLREQLGIQEVIPKPFSVRQLAETIQNHLDALETPA